MTGLSPAELAKLLAAGWTERELAVRRAITTLVCWRKRTDHQFDSQEAYETFRRKQLIDALVALRELREAVPEGMEIDT